MATSAMLARLSTDIASRAVVAVALLFLAFVAYGTGPEAISWCVVLLAAGLAIRAAMRHLNSRAGSISTAPETV